MEARKLGLGPEDVQAAVAGHTGGNCDETDERAGSIHARVSCRAPRVPAGAPPPARHPLDYVRAAAGPAALEWERAGSLTQFVATEFTGKEKERC